MKKIKKAKVNEMIDLFVENHQEFITNLFNENKGLVPIVAILTEKDDNINVNVFPIMNEMENKDFIRYGLIESFKKMLKSKGHTIHCVNFSSEAWMYEASKDEHPNVEKIIKGKEYKKLPKKEVLIMNFDGKDYHKQVTYNIKREMNVGDDGLDEKVILEFDKIMDMDNSEGRFSNLFD